MGNICRSPTAEGVMVHLLQEAGMSDRVHVDSAGTGGWHVGEPPDARSAKCAARRGIPLAGAARQISRQDFNDHDLVLCADASNVRDLLRLLPADDMVLCAKVRRLREFDPASVATGDLDLPDPYYGGPRGFDTVLDHVTAACQGLLDRVRDGTLHHA
jgi:protein-tyrosine phosphatase